MQITSAAFVKGIVGFDAALDEALPQIAFIGRSNVGKSSIINSLTHQKGLAITSSFPGRTQQINLFVINKAFYFLDLPGYGFAKASHTVREELLALIDWYLFNSPYQQKKIVMIIDANIGPTKDDLKVLQALKKFKKDFVVVANKTDKIKKSKYAEQIQKIEALVGKHKIIPYSSHDKVGIESLTEEIFN